MTAPDPVVMAPQAEERLDLERVERTGWVLLAVGIVFDLVLTRSVASALSLTGAGAVAIINFRWLEVVLQRVIQPGRPRFDRSSVLRTLGRMGLLAGLLGALAVAALVVEGLRGSGRGGG